MCRQIDASSIASVKFGLHDADQFENGIFTLKTHQMFSVHTTPEKFENTTITGGTDALVQL